MNTIPMILFLISFVLLLLAGLNVASGRVSLGWLGLAALVLGMIVSG